METRERAARRIISKRRKARVDPSFGLFIHSSQGVGVVDTAGKFSNRLLPLTFAVSVTISGVAPNGVILELGSETNGLTLWYDTATSKLGFACFDGSGDFGFAELSTSEFVTEGQRLDIVGAVLPGRAQGRLWVNGHLEIRGEPASEVTTPPVFSDDSDGGVGVVTGTVNARVPSASAVDLTDISLIGLLNFYNGQLPLGFV